MELSVKLAAETLATDVLEAARELGIELRPAHPGVDDPELVSYFTGEVRGDWAEAERLAARVRSLPGVDGAYVSPPVEPPAEAG